MKFVPSTKVGVAITPDSASKVPSLHVATHCLRRRSILCTLLEMDAEFRTERS
jgi:hypothetical protein